MKKLAVILVDDEPLALENLKAKLEANCEVDILAACQTSDEALIKIPDLQPDAVFMDIDIDKRSGFDILNSLREINFEIVFTTKFNNYASEAYGIGAIHYILKPFDPEELQKAISKIALKKIRAKNGMNKIAIKTEDGMTFIPVNDIIYCKAENSYTRFFLSDGKKVLASKVLKKVEEIKLSPYPFFFRTHRSYLVNINHVESYEAKVFKILMGNGDRVPIVKSNIQKFKDLWD